jgi:hypothetical protein
MIKRNEELGGNIPYLEEKGGAVKFIASVFLAGGLIPNGIKQLKHTENIHEVSK